MMYCNYLPQVRMNHSFEFNIICLFLAFLPLFWISWALCVLKPRYVSAIKTTLLESNTCFTRN